MPPEVMFDIFVLGLKDVSPEGRATFLNGVKQLSGLSTRELQQTLASPENPLFAAVERRQALGIVDALEQLGARIEIRPATPGAAPPARPQQRQAAPPPPPEPVITPRVEDLVPMSPCPACGFEQPATNEECQACGVIYAKYERELLQEQRKERELEAAMNKAFEVRQERYGKAKLFLDKNPLPAGATAPFESKLMRDELPFYSIGSDAGPLLLTSRRLLAEREGRVLSIPFELIADVDMGGGFVQRRNRQRMQLNFQCELPTPKGPAKNLAWSLIKDADFRQEVLLDWMYGPTFICGSCGEKDFDFHMERRKPHARCMHCATDHEVDIDEAVAIPIIID